MAITPNMGLTTWNNVTDFFNHAQLANNFGALDAHDHTTSKGVPIPAGGIAPLAITTAKIADGAVTPAKMSGTIASSQLADLSVTAGKIANQTITSAQIGILPSVRVFGAATSVPNATLTPLSFTTERFDSGLWTVGAPDVFVAPVTGVYLITGTVHFASSASGTYRHVGIRYNGADTIVGNTRTPTTSSVRYLSVTTAYRLVASDYVELVVQQDSGAALNIERTESGSPEFSAVWLGL